MTADALTGLMQTMANLLSVPPDVIAHVAKHLDERTLRRLALVCRHVSEPVRLERVV